MNKENCALKLVDEINLQEPLRLQGITRIRSGILQYKLHVALRVIILPIVTKVR